MKSFGPISIVRELTPLARSRFALCCMGFACVGFAALVARVTGDSLFLSRFPASRLPYVYLAAAAVVATIGIFSGALAGRFGVHRLAAVSAAALSAAAVAIRILLAGHPAAGRIAASIFAEVATTLPFALFWGLASLLFDPREAKRVFGLIGAAGTMACILGGAQIRPAVRVIGFENLLFEVAAAFAIFSLIAIRMGSSLATNPASPAVPMRAPPKLGGNWRDLVRNRQIGSLALLVAASSCVALLVDYQFKGAASSNFDGAELVGFFGQFYALANVFALVIQVFFVHRILEWGGILVGLALLPSLLLTASAGTAMSAGLLWASAARFANHVFGLTVDGSASQLASLAIRKQTRPQARTFLDAVVKPLTMAATAIAILVLRPVSPGAGLAIAAVLVCGAWILLARRASRAYVDGLLESIDARSLDSSNGTVDFASERAFEKGFREKILAADDEEVPYLAAFAGELPGEGYREEFRALLNRESPDAVEAALNYLRDHGTTEDFAAVLPLLEHDNLGVRLAAIGTAAILGGESSTPALRPFLTDPHAAFRAETAVLLINHGDEAGRSAGIETIQTMLASDDAAVRATATAALALIKHGTLGRLVAKLINDPDPMVRAAALGAARHDPDPVLVRRVVEMLGSPDLFASAEETLLTLGPRVVPFLETEMREQAESFSPPAALAAVLARIGDPGAIPILRKLMDHPSPALRSAAIFAFATLAARHPAAAPPADDVENVLRREVQRSVEARRIRERIGNLPGSEPLLFALREEYLVHVRGALELLALRAPGLDPAAIFRCFEDGSREQRAAALEILGNVLRGETREIVFDSFDLERKTRPFAMDAQDAFDDVAELFREGTGDLVLAAALFFAAENGQARALPEATNLLDHPASIVRETALYAVSKLAHPERIGELSAKCAADPSSEVRRLATGLCGGSIQAVTA